MSNKRIQEWAENQCEKITEIDNGITGGEATCDVVAIRGTDYPDILFRLDNEGGTFYGWLHDGEGLREIRWSENDPREQEQNAKSTHSVMELYIDKSANLVDLAWMSQDDIENQIGDMVREHALASEPDASEGEIAEATSNAAHTILLEVRQAVVEAIYNEVSGADNREEQARLSENIESWLVSGMAIEQGATIEQLAAQYRDEQM
jgi:hypothetical protein